MLSLIGSLVYVLRYVYLLVSHISGGGSFPRPLSPEEEEYYLKRFKEDKDEKAKHILIEHNLRLVAHVVKKYSNCDKDVDDLISIGTIGLIKAINTYDSGKKTRLATYAARCIENEILMSIRADKKTKGELSLQEPIGIDKEGNEISLMDILGTDPDAVVEEVESKMQVRNLYKKMNKVLKKRERVVLEMRYGLLNGKHRTQREIAQMLGISRSYVSRIEKRAISKLSKEFGVGGCH